MAMGMIPLYRYFLKKVSQKPSLSNFTKFVKVSMYRGGHSTRVYYINSRNRIEGTDEDFTYDIDLKGLDDPTHWKVLHMYIPKSMYPIQDGSNFFTLVEDGFETVITIPEGAYSLISLKSTLETLLNVGSPNNYTYEITYPNTSIEADTGKLTWNVSDNAGVQPQFIFEDGSRLWEVLGFVRNSTNTFVGDTLTSVNVINLDTEHTLFLHSDIVGESNNILQDVFSHVGNVPYSGIVFEASGDDYEKRLASKTKNTFRFYLTDENDQKINLNGLNIVLTLMVFRKINYFSLFTSFFDLLKGR